ncbi:hypothetical protein POSPLADRAFT_1139418 [Postia placenta MAD-698-R-SB12]|uniref:Uncharacterized protein n=1 Tax=Postia placenta MAD-698-R-SB12 TaxID=670580 RepID=A0A1X6N4Y0_9APHY|nr:hypothetical protein POSPLADRAFT_1139418 [Postia placenta MAD-698-R-SB12]OSX63677.1 hypothetical protein POSPLADRAFT_1139418 [Postia placenta MAD-698-R-SB12]
MHVEWCKVWAWAHRWSEKCKLLQEEMHHIKAYHEWKATMWSRQADCQSDAMPILRKGLLVYAH